MNWRSQKVTVFLFFCFYRAVSLDAHVIEGSVKGEVETLSLRNSSFVIMKLSYSTVV